MAKTKHIHLKVGEDFKEAIQVSADRRANGNVTRLMLRGLIKEAPELKDAMLKDQ